ncbi:MAG TPA: hypothetical protein VN968_06670 [Bradyrhizobium sp.]|nr:hypothetical protein [Bradyrhizobium sp.]
MSYDSRDRHKHNGDRLTTFPSKKTPASGRMLFCSPSGGVGTDTVDYSAVEYSASSAGATVNLTHTGAQSDGDAAGDILSNFENVVRNGATINFTSRSPGAAGGKD